LTDDECRSFNYR